VALWCRTARSLASLAVAVVLAVTVAACSSADPSPTVVPRNDEVLLLPRVEAGRGGWCITTKTRLAWQECGEWKALGGPIYAEDWTGGGISGRYVQTGIAVTNRTVAGLSVDGRGAIPTRTERVVPGGLRVAVVEVRYPGTHREVGLSAPSGLRFPQFAPLDQEGKPLRENRHPGVALALVQPGHAWRHPTNMPRGICGIEATNGAGLAPVEGFVVDRVIAYPGLAGPQWLSCADTVYRSETSQLLASVLLNGLHPGVAPADLPATSPVPGHDGVVRALGSEGEMVARRIPGAWLVVSGGRYLLQRLDVLDKLRATVRPVSPRTTL
jgi:hypothetical protein